MRPFDQLLVASNNFVGGAHNAVRLDCTAWEPGTAPPAKAAPAPGEKQAWPISAAWSPAMIWIGTGPPNNSVVPYRAAQAANPEGRSDFVTLYVVKSQTCRSIL